VVAGAGLAPVFPSFVTLFQQAAGESTARWIGVVLAAGGFGGAALPWMVGWVSSASGGLRSGMSLVAVLLLFLLAAVPRLESAEGDARQQGDERSPLGG
jgi:fucose permease